MKIVISNCDLIRVQTGEYEGNKFYSAVFIENGYPVKFSCSKAFYDSFKDKLVDKPMIQLHDVQAEYREFGDKKRIKLV